MNRGITLVVLVIVLACASPVAAQEPTQAPTPLPTLAGIDGLEDAVSRSFEASGLRLTGTMQLWFLVVRFEDEDAAQTGSEQLVANSVARIDQQADVSDVKKASTGKIGDQAIARAGKVVIDDPGDSPIDSLIVGLVAARRGAYVQLGQGAALAGDPLADVSGVLKKTIDRAEGGEATPVDTDGLRTGGLWDMLTRLDDLPEGFVLDEERVPLPFDPLPGQDKSSAETGGGPPTSRESGSELAEGSLSRPIPLGQSAWVGDGWTVEVVGTVDDPYQIDPSADWFNGWLDQNPPPAGQRFFTARVHLTNLGERANFPAMALSFGFVGTAEYIYDGQYDCGTVPGEVSYDVQLAPGDVVDGNVCRLVRTEDVGSLVMYAVPALAFGEGDRVYFALE